MTFSIQAALFFLSLLIARTCKAFLPVTTLHEFGKGVWVENLNIRPNGNVLATLISAPEIWQVNTTAKSAELVHSFTNATSVFAIVELETDVFYALVGNFSLKTFLGTVGTWRLEKLNFTAGGKPTVSTVLHMPETEFLDGMDVLNLEKGLLLTGDGTQGTVYVIDVHKRTYRSTFSAPEFKPSATLPGGGIDGIRIVGDNVFFTNPALVALGVFGVDTDTGFNTSAVRTLFAGEFFDDLIARPGNTSELYLANGFLGFTEATVTPHAASVRPPELVSLDLRSSTACRFGRTASDRNKLYVTGAGSNPIEYELGVFPFSSYVGVIDLDEKR